MEYLLLGFIKRMYNVYVVFKSNRISVIFGLTNTIHVYSMTYTHVLFGYGFIITIILCCESDLI